MILFNIISSASLESLFMGINNTGNMKEGTVPVTLFPPCAICNNEYYAYHSVIALWGMPQRRG